MGASPHGRGRYSRGALAALGVQAGPAGIEGESQELKQEGLALPNPALLLCQLQKLIPPRAQPQCPIVAKYSITQFLHQCIPSMAMGLVPVWPVSAGSRRGRWEPGASVLEQPLTHFKSWPTNGSWLPFRSRQALQEERQQEVIASPSALQPDVFAEALSIMRGRELLVGNLCSSPLCTSCSKPGDAAGTQTQAPTAQRASQRCSTAPMSYPAPRPHAGARLGPSHHRAHPERPSQPWQRHTGSSARP